MKEWVWPWIFAVLIAILVYAHTDGLNYNVYHMLRFWFSQKTCYQFLVKVNHKPHFHCLPRIRADLNKPYILFQFIWQYIVILIWFGLVSDKTSWNVYQCMRELVMEKRNPFPLESVQTSDLCFRLNLIPNMVRYQLEVILEYIFLYVKFYGAFK